MSDMGDTTRGVSAEVDASGGRVQLFCSPNVFDTIGRPGLLEERIGATSVIRTAPRRSDVFLQEMLEPDLAALADAPPFLTEGPGAGVEDPYVRVVVLSLEPELVGPAPWRHRDSGWLIQPSSDYLREWPQSVVDWLHDSCEPVPDLTAARSLENLARITSNLMEDGRSVIIFGVSTYDPTDQTHRYSVGANTYELRAHRIMAGLEDMASDLGCAVVDVDGAVAEVGAIGSVPAPCRLEGAVLEFVTEEAVLAIDHSGALDDSLQPQVMTVRVPQFDRRTTDGVIAKWHISPGDEVTDGDTMFDVRFVRKVHRFDMVKEEEAAPPWRRRSLPKRARTFPPFDLSVIAGGNVVLREVVAAVGANVSVGSIVAIVTTESSIDAGVDDASGDFRTGIRPVAS